MALSPTDIGLDMLATALTEWYRYDDFGDFDHAWHGDGQVTVTDRGENVSKTFAPLQFFESHTELIFKRGAADKVAAQYLNWVTDTDDYDAITCDVVLQIGLYGEVIYG